MLQLQKNILCEQQKLCAICHTLFTWKTNQRLPNPSYQIEMYWWPIGSTVQAVDESKLTWMVSAILNVSPSEIIDWTYNLHDGNL